MCSKQIFGASLVGLFELSLVIVGSSSWRFVSGRESCSLMWPTRRDEKEYKMAKQKRNCYPETYKTNVVDEHKKCPAVKSRRVSKNLCRELHEKLEKREGKCGDTGRRFSTTNKKRNDNEKQTLKIGFFICIGKSNQANVKTSARHIHNIKPMHHQLNHSTGSSTTAPPPAIGNHTLRKINSILLSSLIIA